LWFFTCLQFRRVTVSGWTDSFLEPRTRPRFASPSQSGMRKRHKPPPIAGFPRVLPEATTLPNTTGEPDETLWPAKGFASGTNNFSPPLDSATTPFSAPELIQRISETKEALYRQHVRFSWRSLAIPLLAEVKLGSSFPSSATSRFAGARKAVGAEASNGIGRDKTTRDRIQGLYQRNFLSRIVLVNSYANAIRAECP
jgi:hypothetical protein